MKTFTRRFALAVAIVVVAGLGWFGLKRYKDTHAPDSKQPTDASINGNIYTNNFFQFAVQFPAGWKVLRMDSRPQVSAKASSYILLISLQRDRE